MTYGDIKTKFLIEYDKDDITSSYPSLTDYEIGTILDKAYLAIIAEKFTGNNSRRQAFETDVKAIEDLKGLVSTELSESLTRINGTNAFQTTFSNTDILYYISSLLVKAQSGESGTVVNTIKLVDHQTAQRFVETDINYPWIKSPVVYVEDSKFILIVDPETVDTIVNDENYAIQLHYIQKPESFIKNNQFNSSEIFALSDTMSEELINLAIVMALENVEAPRINTKLQTNQLES